MYVCVCMFILINVTSKGDIIQLKVSTIVILIIIPQIEKWGKLLTSIILKTLVDKKMWSLVFIRFPMLKKRNNTLIFLSSKM